jgi:hypothetical protein
MEPGKAPSRRGCIIYHGVVCEFGELDRKRREGSQRSRISAWNRIPRKRIAQRPNRFCENLGKICCTGCEWCVRISPSLVQFMKA